MSATQCIFECNNLHSEVARAPGMTRYVRPIGMHSSRRQGSGAWHVESLFPIVQCSPFTLTLNYTIAHAKLNFLQTLSDVNLYSHTLIIWPLLWSHHSSIMPSWQRVGNPYGPQTLVFIWNMVNWFIFWRCRSVVVRWLNTLIFTVHGYILCA